MAQFKRPTTLDLINNGKYTNAADNTIIETLGYTTKGDGGAGQWRKTGVTGLTASQTPAQLVDAKLTDANGHEWALVFEGGINVKQLGAAGDWDVDLATGTNDWPVVQGGYDALGKAGGGELFLPMHDAGKAYGLYQAIRFRYPNITVRCESPDTRVHVIALESGLASWPAYSCALMGTYLTSNVALVPFFSLNAVTRNDEVVTTTAAGEASNFSVGDVILVQSTSRYTIGSGTRPIWGQMNVVTSVDAGTGIVGLRHPVQETGAAEVQNLSNNGTTWRLSNGTDTGEAQYATRDCKILGGWWSTAGDDEGGKDEAPFNGAGGFIDCEINVDRVTARSGCTYGNLIAHSSLECRLQQTRQSGVELAYCSHDNKISVVTDEQRDQSSLYSPIAASVWINESSRNNVVKVGTLHCNNFDHNSAVQFLQCSGNLVEINKVYAESVTEAVVQFVDLAYTGTRPDCTNNTCKIGSSHSAASVDYMRFVSNGQESHNTVDGGKFYGSVSNAVSWNSGGADCFDVVKGAWCENGGLLAGGSATNFSVIDSHIPDGIPRSGDWDNEYQKGNYINLSTTKSLLMREAKVVRRSQNATNASPFVLTSTIKANAFGLGDVLQFYLTSFIGGGSSGSNKTYSVAFGGNVVQAYNTTSTGASEVIIRGTVTYNTSTNATVSYVVYQDDAVVSTRCDSVGSIDFTTDEDFTITVTPANAGDTINIRHAQAIGVSADSGQMLTV